jgi:signal transduction histidine kinase
MFADMLAAPDLPEAKRTRFASTISRESERLGALIERLLMFNALAKGGPAAVVTSVDVGAVVRETLEEMDATLLGAGFTVEPTLPEKTILAATDRSALKQALLNLLENALKYARDGRVIRVALVDETGGVRVRVADNGPGIPRELGTRVFEPFVQGGRTLTDKSPGVGLGLSIARGLLRQAGGDLVLLPAEKGAVFEIRLPHVSPS